MSFILKYLFRVHVVEGQFLIRYLEYWSAALFACCAVLLSISLLFLMPFTFIWVIPFTILGCLCYFYVARRVFRAMRRVTDNGRGPVICNQLRPLVFRTLSFGVRRVLMWSWTVMWTVIIVGMMLQVSVEDMKSGDALFYLVSTVLFGIVSVFGIRALMEWIGIVTRSRAVACELKEMHVEPSYFVPEQSTDQAPLWKMVRSWVVVMVCIALPGSLFFQVSWMSVFLALFPLVFMSSRLLGDGRGTGSRLRIPRQHFLIYFAVIAYWVFRDVGILLFTKQNLFGASCVLVEIFCLVLAVCTSEMCYAVMGKPDAADEQQTGQPDKEGENVIVGNI